MIWKLYRSTYGRKECARMKQDLCGQSFGWLKSFVNEMKFWCDIYHQITIYLFNLDSEQHTLSAGRLSNTRKNTNQCIFNKYRCECNIHETHWRECANNVNCNVYLAEANRTVVTEHCDTLLLQLDIECSAQIERLECYTLEYRPLLCLTSIFVAVVDVVTICVLFLFNSSFLFLFLS